MKIFSLSVCFFLVITTPLIAGEMYIWTDAQGGKHITTTPPPEKAKVIEKTRYTRDDPREIEAFFAKQKRAEQAQEQRRQQNAAINEARSQAAEEKRYAQKTREQKEQNLRDKIDLLRDINRSGTPMDDINRRILDTIEKQQKRKQQGQ